MLAVLVCHNGATWLGDTLAALASANRRPRHLLAVDTGSTDDTPRLLSEALADGLLDGVLTMPAATGFGAAVRHAVDRAEQRWGDPGRWLWLLHDDSAPDPSCLDVLVRTADASPSVALLGPLCLDWSDPRLVVEAGLSTDASGHRQTGLGADELDPSLLGGGLAQNTEVLAVGSAGALVRRDLWHRLGGYDPALPMLRDDLDFGWRVNRADQLVLVVPTARIRHAVAAGRGLRPMHALGGTTRRAADRAHGLRTFLVNASAMSFVLGVPRLGVLCLLRALGFTLARRPGAARAELAAVRHLLSGRAGLLAARRARRTTSVGRAGVRGLLTSRWRRLRNTARGGLLALMRRRMAADAAIGHLPADSASWVPTTAVITGAAGRVAGPDTLPAGALGRPRRRAVSSPEAYPGLRPGAPDAGTVRPGPWRSATGRRGLAASVAGLRRPGISVVVPTGDTVTTPTWPAPPDTEADTRPDVLRDGVPAVPSAATVATAPEVLRPSPSPRGQPAPRSVPELIVVDVGAARLVRELLLAPAVLLVVGLATVAAGLHRGRYGLDLTGGRLAPSLGLADTWSSYLAEWHPVFGGTAAPAPAGLAVFGALGALLRPFGGGPGAAVSLLLLCAIPLAGLSAYFATRRMLVPRWGRALGAAAYALLPVGTAAAVQGRLDGVVAHVLLPAVLAGVAGVLSGWSVGRGGTRGWLPSAAATALGLAVISAFAPLVHLLVLVLVLVGFVAVAGPRGQGLRRVVALFVIVLLPLGLLLPWPAVVLQHPEVLLHGVGATVDELTLRPQRLLMLDAGGAGPTDWLGALVAAGCLLVVAARPRRAAVPGMAVALLGFAAAVVVSTLTSQPLAGGAARPGWPGAALLLASCGLVWAALGALSARPAAPPRRPWRARPVPAVLVPTVATALVLVLAGSVVFTGTIGQLATERARLGPAVEFEAQADRTGVLVVGGEDEPVRASVGRLPAFGDDDLAPVATAPTRMARWAAAFRAARDEDRPPPGEDTATPVQSAVLEAAAAGIEFVVLPDRDTADGLLRAAGPLVVDTQDTTDGRPTVRLLLQPGSAVVLAASLADRARTGGAPPLDYRSPGNADGVASVQAAPPALRVVIGAGADGRTLVVAAEMEDGWLATVDGERVPVGRAWGHLVAVPLPADEAEVRLERSSTLRTLLLLAQLAVALFTAITAIPPGDRRDRNPPRDVLAVT